LPRAATIWSAVGGGWQLPSGPVAMQNGPDIGAQDAVSSSRDGGVPLDALICCKSISRFWQTFGRAPCAICEHVQNPIGFA
jgi:hypothetical protein